MMVMMTNAEKEKNNAFDVAQVRRKTCRKNDDGCLMMMMSDALFVRPCYERRM